MIVGPTNLKPRRSMSLLIAADTSVEAGQVGHRLDAVDDGLAAYEGPDVRVQRAELALHGQRRLRVADGGGDLGAVADDSRVGEQALGVGGPVGGDAGDVPALEGAPVSFAALEDRLPAQAGLGALQGQQLEQACVVVLRHAPLLVVVAHHEVVIGPVADPFAA